VLRRVVILCRMCHGLYPFHTMTRSLPEGRAGCDWGTVQVQVERKLLFSLVRARPGETG